MVTTHPLCPFCAGRAAMAPSPADHGRIHANLDRMAAAPNRAQRKRGARDLERGIRALTGRAEPLSGPCRCGAPVEISARIHGLDRTPRHVCARCHARTMNRLPA